jgi:hypothetical protein
LRRAWGAFENVARNAKVDSRRAGEEKSRFYNSFGENGRQFCLGELDKTENAEVFSFG